LKQRAFTLAEVLITLGIIGIVAAMTIPTLMENVQDYQLKQAWKKEFSVLQQATVSYLQDNATFKNTYASFWHDYLKSDYVNYLRTIKVCSGDPNPETTYGYCWSTAGTTKYLNGSVVASNSLPLGNGSAGVVLQDGAYIIFAYQDNTCASINVTPPGNEGLANICGWIAVDVNGAKNPNVVGKDIFAVWVLENKIIPFGTMNYASTCSTSDTGLGCSAQYLTQ